MSGFGTQAGGIWKIWVSGFNAVLTSQ